MLLVAQLGAFGLGERQQKCTLYCINKQCIAFCREKQPTLFFCIHTQMLFISLRKMNWSHINRNVWKCRVAIGKPSSSKCARLHNVAASNNRHHTPCSLCCLFAPHKSIDTIFSAHPVCGASCMRRRVDPVYNSTKAFLNNIFFSNKTFNLFMNNLVFETYK